MFCVFVVSLVVPALAPVPAPAPDKEHAARPDPDLVLAP